MPVVEAGGLRVNYSDTGLGAPIVFIPGITGSKEWFCYQSSGLGDRYRIISYDYRLARGRAKYTLELLVNDLCALLAALRVANPVIVGYSFGGLIAISLAARRPELCRALALVSTAPNYREIPTMELMEAVIPGKIEFESFITRLWKRIFGRSVSREAEEIPLDFLKKYNGKIDESTLHARIRIIAETDLTTSLATIALPTLITAGSEEIPHIHAAAQTMYEEIPNSTLEIIEGTDHYGFFTRHDLFNAVLDDFISRELPAP